MTIEYVPKKASVNFVFQRWGMRAGIDTLRLSDHQRPHAHMGFHVGPDLVEVWSNRRAWRMTCARSIVKHRAFTARRQASL